MLLDNFVNASARDEERERLRKIEEAKSYKVGGVDGVGWGGWGERKKSTETREYED